MRKPSLLAFALPMLAGCRTSSLLVDNSFGSPVASIKVTDAAKELSTSTGQTLCNGVNGLGFSMLRNLSQAQPEQNIDISPTSIALAVGMARNGARGDTEACISDTLGVKGVSEDNFARGCLNLAALFENSDPKVEVDVANSLWTSPSMQIEPSFLDICRQYYDAAVSNVDLSSDAGLKTVNDWVKRKTKGKIPTILGSAQAGAAMVLLDAVYFKGDWDTPFDEQATDQEPFHLAGGSSQTVAMMRRTDYFSYSQSGNSQMLSIPYKGQHLAMLIYLPDEDTPLPETLDAMTPERWAQGVADMHRDSVDLHMPKFSVKFSASLKEALSAAGMGRAFQAGAANFRGISESRLFISDVLHKTTTDVDEKGTVATAATAVVMGVTSAGPPPEPPKPIEFIADHPLLYAIYDTSTKAILFVGVLYDP